MHSSLWFHRNLITRSTHSWNWRHSLDFLRNTKQSVLIWWLNFLRLNSCVRAHDSLMTYEFHSSETAIKIEWLKWKHNENNEKEQIYCSRNQMTYVSRISIFPFNYNACLCVYHILFHHLFAFPIALFVLSKLHWMIKWGKKCDAQFTQVSLQSSFE